MWYSVVDPNSPGYKNKVVASFYTWSEADDFAELCSVDHSHHIISTPTKPAIGEVVDPNDLAEDERW